MRCVERPGSDIDELTGDTHAVTSPAHAAFEDSADAAALDPVRAWNGASADKARRSPEMLAKCGPWPKPGIAGCDAAADILPSPALDER